MADDKLSSLLDKTILQGDGHISIGGDQDKLIALLSSDAAFPEEDVDKLLVLNIVATPEREVKIGGLDSLAVGIKANASLKASLDIIQAGDSQGVALLKEYGLDGLLQDTSGEMMYLVFRTDAEASVGASLSEKWKQYGLSGSFGVEAGGDFHVAYLRRFPVADHSAKDVLTTYFKGLRLPQNVSRAPEVGEVFQVQFGGYLNANAGLSWGYSMTRSTGVSLGEIDLQNKIFLEAQAKLNLAFGLAGNFDVEVRRARDNDDNWARVTIRKSRNRSFEFAADLAVKATLETEGLPEKPSEFLEGILGLRASDQLNQILAYVDDFADADPAAIIDQLKTKADGLTKRFIDDFTKRVLGKTLDELATNKDIKKIHQRLVEIKDLHDNLGARVIGYLEDQLGGVDIEGLIAKLKAATDDLQNPLGLQDITDAEVWRLLEVLVDSEWLDVIKNVDQAFDKLRERVEKLEQANLDRLSDFIDAKKEALNLGPLLDELTSINPTDLKGAANKYLQDLAERLTGMAAEQIQKASAKEIKKLQKEVKKLKAKLTNFTSELYDQFENALNSSHSLSLAYRYKNTDEKKALVEVDINLAATADGATPSGPALLKEAVSGDFRSVFKFAALDRVVIRQGELTHNISRAHTLSVNLFGWKGSRTDELISNVQEVVEQKDGGVLHIYDIEAKKKSTRKRRGEEVEQTLAFNVMATNLQATSTNDNRIVDTVTAMGSAYDLRIDDPKTSRSELRSYLDFADHLGLIPNEYAGIVVGDDGTTSVQHDRITGYLDEVAEELQLGDTGDFGKVTLKYHLQYDAAAMMAVFSSLEVPQLMKISRDMLTTIGAFVYSNFYPGLAEAYVEPAMRATWRNNELKEFNSGTFIFKIKKGDQTIRIKLKQIERRALAGLYGVEEDFIEQLLRLNDILDRVGDNEVQKVKDLSDVLTKFVKYQKDLNTWFDFRDRAVVPPFLAVLNRLSTKALLKRRTWSTTLEMKLEAGDNTITKFLVL